MPVSNGAGQECSLNVAVHIVPNCHSQRVASHLEIGTNEVIDLVDNDNQPVIHACNTDKCRLFNAAFLTSIFQEDPLWGPSVNVAQLSQSDCDADCSNSSKNPTNEGDKSEVPCIDPRYFAGSVADFIEGPCHPAFVSKFWHLGFISYNVLSMLDKDKTKVKVGFADVGRRCLMLDEADNNGIIFLCFQEARTKQSSFVEEEGRYLIISSGSESGNLGLETWVSLNHNISPSPDERRSLYLKRENVCALVSEPRILLLAVRANGFALNILNLHAHTCGKGTHISHVQRDSIIEFWKRVCDIVKHFCKPDVPLVVCGDMNARVGSFNTESISDFMPDEQCFQGEIFHRFLCDHNLFVPQTFADMHDDTPSYTYCKAGLHRIDYVCFPLVWNKRPITSGTLPLFGDACAMLDHIPVFANAHGTAGGKFPWFHKRRLCYDRDKLAKADDLGPMLDSLHAGVNIVWHEDWYHGLDIHGKVHVLNSIVRDCMCNHFPLVVSPPRKRYVSPGTVELVHERNTAGVSLRSAKLSLAYAHPECIELAFDSHQQHLEIFKQLRAQVNCSLKADKQAFYKDLATRCKTARSEGDIRSLFYYVRKFAPRVHGKGFPLIKKGGVVCGDPIKGRYAVRDHFAELNRAIKCSAHDLVSANTKQTKKQGSHFCPSIDQWWSACGVSKPHSAPGSDTIPPELVKSLRDFFVWAYYPVVQEASSTKLHPVQWLGGPLQDIPKNVLSSNVEDKRGVLLKDCLGKNFNKILRGAIAPSLGSYMISSMYGGFLERGVDFASLHVKSLIAYSKVRNMSIGILYIDVCAAFESVIRQIVFGPTLSDESIVMLFKMLNFNEECFHEFLRVCQSSPAMIEAGVPQELIDSIASAMDGSWFSIEGVAGVCVHDSGSGAGDPIGDLIFSFLICKVLRECRKRMQHLSLLDIPLPEKDSVLGRAEDLQCSPESQISYIDDCSFVAIDSVPENVIAKVVAITGITVDVFASHALKCNFKKGKSEASFALRGVGAQAAKAELYKDSPNSCLKCNTLSVGVVNVNIVQFYKHVGSINDPSRGPSQDITYHVNRGYASLAALNPSLLSCSEVDISTKWIITNSMVMSRTFWASATWSQLTEPCLLRVQKFYHKCIRIAYEIPLADHISDRLMLEQTERLSLQHVMLIKRMALLARVIVKAPAELKSLIVSVFERDNRAIGWLSLCMQDLEYLFFKSSLFDELGCPSIFPAGWFDFIYNFPVQFRQCVFKIVRSCEQVPYEHQSVQVACTDCPECGRQFPINALQAHRHKAHGHTNPFRKKVSTTHCACCLKEFWTLTRAFHHIVRRSPKCCSYYANHMNDEPEAEIEALETQEREALRLRRRSGLHRLHSARPVARLHGPKTEMAYVCLDPPPTE